MDSTARECSNPNISPSSPDGDDHGSSRSPSAKRLIVKGAARGFAASLIVPVGIGIALCFHSRWIENVSLAAQVAFFSANYVVPSILFTVISAILGGLGKDAIRRNKWVESAVGGILGAGGPAIWFACFIYFSPQGLGHGKHALLVAPGFLNTLISGLIAYDYVNRQFGRTPNIKTLDRSGQSDRNQMDC